MLPRTFGRSLVTAASASILIACTESTTESASEVNLGNADSVNISEAIFTERSADCGDYVNTYVADALDIQNSLPFEADVEITASDTACTLTSNSVPNHSFNDASAAFAGGAEGATITETDASFTISRNPQLAALSTPISQEVKNGIFLNGVVLDIISAGCYLPSSPDADADGNVGIGCASTADWLLDPLSTTHKFGADEHNAHTQPGGLYHYHGGPNAMFDDNPSAEGSPVIGFAADGFPIYGSYFFDIDTGSVRKAVSGYTVKAGSRSLEGTAVTPPGDYSGMYNQDWEWTDAGDLDACNGMVVDGQYGYYVTDSYPWVLACLSGTPDDSFVNSSAGGGPGGPPPTGDAPPNS